MCIGAQQPSGVTNYKTGQPFPWFFGDGTSATASCLWNKQVVAIPRFVVTRSNPLRCCHLSPPGHPPQEIEQRHAHLTLLHKPATPRGLPIFAGSTDYHVPTSFGWAAHHFGHTLSPHLAAMGVLAKGVSSVQTWHPWTCSVGSPQCVPPLCAHHIVVVAGHNPLHVRHVDSYWCNWYLLQWSVKHQGWKYVLIFSHERDVGNWLPIPHTSALKTHWPNWNIVFCREFLIPRAQRATMDLADQKAMRGWEELDNKWCAENYQFGNTKAHNPHDKQKNPTVPFWSEVATCPHE